MRSIALAQSYDELNRPIEEEACFGYLDGSALLACGIIPL